jgi:hypothetical protein
MPNPAVELTILMPCLNEAASLEDCIRDARLFLTESGVEGEILVADNGSTDGSPDLAARAGARVIRVPQRGYGNALRAGIEASAGTLVIMGDADHSYDFRRLHPFLAKLREGFDLVMGNRFQGGIAPGAMPALHRYLGNPVLSALGRILFRSPVRDFHCGLRGVRKESIVRLNLQTTGMEFASEMVVKATLFGMRVAEVATTLRPASRNRPPHLRTWRDGWRHLRFLLLYSPRWLFLYPGLALMLGGGVAAAALLPGPIRLGETELDVHTLLYAIVTVVLGFQAVLFAVFTQVFAISEGFIPEDARLRRAFGYVTLEVGLVCGLLMLTSGSAMSLAAYLRWKDASFGPLYPSEILRLVLPAVLLIVLGFQTILASFFLSVLGLGRHPAVAHGE